jgi:hypothetical protein
VFMAVDTRVASEAIRLHYKDVRIPISRGSISKRSSSSRLEFRPLGDSSSAPI